VPDAITHNISFRKLAKVVIFVNFQLLNSEALLHYNQFMFVCGCIIILLPFSHTAVPVPRLR